MQGMTIASDITTKKTTALSFVCAFNCQAKLVVVIVTTSMDRRKLCLPQVWLVDERRCAYLILDKKLDTLNGCGGGLRDGGRDTTHWKEVLSVSFFSAGPNFRAVMADV